MTRLLEDYLNEAEVRAIDRVLSSEEVRFDKLVSLSGLDPRLDFAHADLRGLNFCHADLRNFNFSGADLRGCIVDKHTIIDDSTNLEDAKIDWIEADTVPIVEKMRSIGIAASTSERVQGLKELVSEFGRTKHVKKYLIAAAQQSGSIEEFIDYASFIPKNIENQQYIWLESSSERLLKRRFSRSYSRTRRSGTTRFAANEVLNKIESCMTNSSDNIVQIIYNNLAKNATETRQFSDLGAIATVIRRDDGGE